MKQIKQWFVYLLECCDGTLYTGITTELNRRIAEHNSSEKGAKYTKTRRPVKLVYYESSENRSLASKRELEIKKLSRSEKLKFIDNFNKL